MHLRELDANLLVVFDALLLDASVTKAAERLGRSPSAVSHSLARLREIFDDPLFVRAGQRLVPTTRATQLAPTVHLIVSGIEGLLRRHNSFDPADQQRIFAVACDEIGELTLLARLRQKLAVEAPGITLERRPLQPQQMLEELRSGDVQLAVAGKVEPAFVNDITSEELYRDQFVALAPVGHPLVAPGVTMPAFIEDDTPIYLGSTPVRDDVVCHLTALGMNTDMRLRKVSSPLVALHLALEDNAIVLLPQSVGQVAQMHTRLLRIPVELELPLMNVFLIWHVSQERDECHAWLRAELRKFSQSTQNDIVVCSASS